jgi:hypothetical protein
VCPSDAGVTPCANADGIVTACCTPDETCGVDGTCGQCNEGQTYCGRLHDAPLCCNDFDPDHPAFHGICCPTTRNGPECVDVNDPLSTSDNTICCEFITGAAFVCPSPDRNGTNWKCCTPAIVTLNSDPGWCCHADSTCNPTGFPEDHLCL